MKINTLLLTVFFSSLLFTTIKGQTLYPQGIYLNEESLESKTPKVEKNFNLRARGNYLQLESTTGKYEKRFLRKKVYAYSDGDSLYFNGYREKINCSYVKADELDNYLIFTGGVKNYMNLILGAAVGLPTMGIGTSIGMSIASNMRRTYLYDVRSGELMKVNKKKLVYLLQNVPQLRQEYLNQPSNANHAVIKEYLLKIDGEHLPK